MQVLLCCARRSMTPEHAVLLRSLVRPGIDWDRLMLLARRHNMLPLLYWHLRAEMHAIPAQRAERLQHAFLGNAGQMLKLAAELLELATLFSQQRISMVPYKGPALGADLYGNLALRQSVDLDLLVARRDVVRARALLVALGYQPRHVVSRWGEEFMLRDRYSEEFAHDSRATLELHWAFTNGDVDLPLDLDALAPRLRSIRLGGGTVSVFGREDMLLILCIHGCKHRWERLEWLCGVAETLRGSSHDLDWDALLGRASSLGVRRMLSLGVLLAHDLLEAPAPERFLHVARSDRAVARLAARVPVLFIADPVYEDGVATLASDIFRLELRERFRDRLRFVWYRLTTPSSPESWSGITVGALPVPMHGILRPLRVLSKLIPALRRYRQVSRAPQ
jgi:hypothetical protein